MLAVIDAMWAGPHRAMYVPQVYRPVPRRASLLFFCIADLASLDPMYQFSLSYFSRLFGQCVDAAAR